MADVKQGLRLDKIEMDKLNKIQEEIVDLKQSIDSIVQTIQGDIFNSEKRLKVMMSKVEEESRMCRELLEVMSNE